MLTIESCQTLAHLATTLEAWADRGVLDQPGTEDGVNSDDALHICQRVWALAPGYEDDEVLARALDEFCTAVESYESATCEEEYWSATEPGRVLAAALRNHR